MKKNDIKIINFDKLKTNQSLVKKIAENLVREKFKKEKVSLSLVLAKNKTIKEMNKKFRNKNKGALSLAFPLTEQTKFIIPSNYLFLGDIIINIEEMENEKNKKEVLKKSIIHSFLHLLNFNHDNLKNEKIMEKEEKKLLGALNDI